MIRTMNLSAWNVANYTSQTMVVTGGSTKDGDVDTAQKDYLRG